MTAITDTAANLAARINELESAIRCALAHSDFVFAKELALQLTSLKGKNHE